MSLEARKIAFIQEILRIQNEEIMDGLEKLFYQNKMVKNQRDLTPMTLEEYYAELNQAMNDIENGRIVSADDLKAKMKKWD
ncbi:MAG: hypothetical protein ACRCYO_10595 [Bacteroidia bacterium]